MSQLAFPRPLTTVDVVVLALKNNQLNILLLQRPNHHDEPFPEKWALPGGFVDVAHDQTLYDCARRKLEEKTGIQSHYLEQVGSWGNATRDPRGWSATHVYVALLSSCTVVHDDAKWFPIQDSTVQVPLAFDHDILLSAALERVRGKTEYTSMPAYLLPEHFTLSELQKVYEIVLARTLEKKAFRTRMLAADLLEELSEQKETGRRPAQLYQLKNRYLLTYFTRNFEANHK